jgi:hypothetical protein
MVRPTNTFVPAPPTRPVPPSCGYAVAGNFANVWNSVSIYQRLGCPSGSVQSVFIAEESFRGGMMAWREDKRIIYALFSDGTWKSFQDTWYDGQPEYTCGQPPSPPQPIRGFGRVWCTQSDVKSKLGSATEGEVGNDYSIQDFTGGMIYASARFGTTILFNDDKTWSRR